MFLSSRRNIERICEDVRDAEYFRMQHFISDSNWDARAVMDRAAAQTGGSLPKNKLTELIVDETGKVKKGGKSVGVGWQYCGNAGKTANSQVAVMACLSNGDFASLVDARLYLPEDWCGDRERCREAGIPEEHTGFKTKPEPAFDIIRHQAGLGVGFDFVGGDGLYGNGPGLANNIDGPGLTYMLDIHKDRYIHTAGPNLAVPPKKGRRGENRSCPDPTGNP